MHTVSGGKKNNFQQKKNGILLVEVNKIDNFVSKFFFYIFLIILRNNNYCKKNLLYIHYILSKGYH